MTSESVFLIVIGLHRSVAGPRVELTHVPISAAHELRWPEPYPIMEAPASMRDPEDHFLVCCLRAEICKTLLWISKCSELDKVCYLPRFEQGLLQAASREQKHS
jgi:hypothetical protein